MQSSRAPPRPKALNWTPQSHLAVFVRNIQLLQLDQRDDWPGITVRSLSPTSQTQQRQRIKAVEWALYQLVTIWDLETARDKLRPFFPPLEPLQSVNLRAALFRVLSELKKNGELGRETILRKSMLDDCKGEKFDEILAVFSTTVLRKAVAESSDNGLRNPAMKMSTASGLSRQEYQQMLPLIIAHRASLRSMGDRRSRVQSTHEKFSELLDRKKGQLDSRAEEGPPMLADKQIDFYGTARELKTNWLGSEEWADTLLHGGARSSNDAFLELPFGTAWARANESTVEDLSTSATPDLLLDLESRISLQRARLNRWRQYGSSIQKHERINSTNTSKGTSLAFRDHQPLTVASISKAVRQPVERVSLKAEDRSLLFSMTEALARINGTSGRTGQLRGPSAGTSAHSSAEGDLAEKTSSSLPSRDPTPPEKPASSTATHPRLEEDPIPPASPTVQVSPSPSPSPSPPIDTDPDPESQPPIHKVTLVERTRKSMSLLPPPSAKPPRPRESLRSRHSRMSFPVNQFETPQKQAARFPDISRASTPQDDLFKEEADYASVFKSRPRVAHSPINSPVVHFAPIDDFDLVDDGEEDDYEEDLEEMGIESPSFRRR
ncbi:hypothetical protein P170DRAFT_465430 [Aspergillus steynii IBT 23096]|uniref:HAUS augmin-like complex subunit 6 N-terminal domain-containing protein n=1 Tax=Aspergillus steynii IBT 23096 TaxID=1392250 RepID=A0A2I2G4Y5_9EURO|nr:uncharacterized protein P170DRAFT_465430 [Aspergillus steynii IBT 23096]PLB47913.1 hypothetical protein P170DRAFT_465430 [Aspergillus steynii IBT 23096]